MTDIIKDVEEVAGAAAGLRTRLILAAIAAGIMFVLALGVAHYFENRGRLQSDGVWATKLATVNAGWAKKEADERVADAAMIEQHHQDMNALEQHHLLIEKEISDDHNAETAQLRKERDDDRRRADAAGGLRIPAPAAAACPAGSAVAGTEAASAGGRDEPASASTVRLPEQIENDLWAIADDADEVSAQLRACQSFVRRNGFYGPEIPVKPPLLDRMIAVPNQTPEATP